ncbi:hypothetical protein JCM3765_001487 [Sporobolomyces pararoseus]
MDRLPLELLRMIADRVELDSDLARRRTTLAGLSRTNKALHSVCNPRLYLHPIISSRSRMLRWSRIYTSPWTIPEGERGLKDLPLPQSRSPSPSGRQSRLLPRQECIIAVLLSKLHFGLSFVRSHASQRLIAALFGPLGSNRTSIKSLSLGHPIVSFLVEAYGRMEWSWEAREDEVLSLLEKIKGKGWLDSVLGEERNNWDRWREVENKVDRLALVDHEIFQHMDAGLEWEPMDSIIDNILGSTEVLSHPFESLERLDFEVYHLFELYLIILHSRLFPRLSHCRIRGASGVMIERDWLLICLSITELNGSISPPTLDYHRDYLYRPVTWEPLSHEEKTSGPQIDYIGPNLVELDLSKFTFLDD